MLWILLGFANTGASIWLSSIYMAFFFLAMYYFASRKLFQTIAKETTTLMKFSLLMNFFSAILLVQSFITFWSARASALAMLFVIVYVGFWIFASICLSGMQQGKNIFFGEKSDAFDPAANQGRKAKKD